MRIAVVGCGVVGGAVAAGMERLGHEVFRHDPSLYSTDITDVVQFKPAITFICVPSPQKEDGSCDTSVVEEVVGELDYLKCTGIIAIKSTVEPGTTKRLLEKYQPEDPALAHIAFVPEFLREKSAFYDFTEGHDTCVIGVTSAIAYDLIKRAHGHYPKRFVWMSPTEAELTKYFSNVYNALRITFANGFYDVCKELGADYSKIKNAVISRGTATDLYLDCNENFRGFAGVCVIPETKVYTLRGLKRIDEIKIGDRVYTIDGSPQNVEDVFVRKVKDERMWRIKGQGTGGFVITSEHPVFAMKTRRCYRTINGKLKLTNSKDGKFEWIDASDLEKGDMLALPLIKDSGLSSFPSKKLARLCGYYTAEGSLENNSNRISLSFHSNEDDYMSDVSNIVKELYGIETHIAKNGNKAQQRFSHRGLRNLLASRCGKYSDQKELAIDLMQADDDCIKNFLCGYFRGDGSLSGDRFTVATASKRLHEQTKLLLLRLGISFNTVERQKYRGQDGVLHQRAYYIKVSNYDDFVKICNIMQLSNTRSQPKFERKTSWFDSFDGKDLMAIPIKSIEKIRYSGDVFNLEVAGNNTYVVEDAIVHNCLPKDTAAFAHLADKLGVDARIFETIVEDNKLYKPTVFEGMRME